MKSTNLWLVIVGLVFFSATAPAATRYVNVNSAAPVAPYTNWATAALTIQSAVDVAISGDVVLVTNGIYQTGGKANSGTNRVSVDSKILMVQSINGPGVTIIQGHQVPGTTNGASSVRCVYLASGATLSGFTLTNGSAAGNGGGIYCQSSSANVSNCIISGNSASGLGGGGYLGAFINCRISGNTSFSSGGGIFEGGATNCLIIGNWAQNGGGTYASGPINCTIVGNTAAVAGGGVNGASGATMVNCIVYNNSAPNGSNNTLIKMDYCCTVPAVGSSSSFTNAPGFVDPATGNFHLQTSSPCINAGSNADMTNRTDLDGNPRIVGGTVDLGAYEFQATIRYVNLSNPTPVTPFTSWLTAATNIQNAIDAASAGDFILVSNGVYSYGGRAVYGLATNRVTADKAVTVQSVNGAAATVIAGSGNRGTPGIRCVYLTNGTALIGFTLTNGATRFTGDAVNEQSGGGVWCETNSVIVSNCVFTGNYANQNGGGAFRGTLFNCIFTNNVANRGAGACSNVLSNCSLTKNFALFQNLDSGGGAIYSTLRNCLLVANACNGGGGGASFSTLTSCVVSNNTGNSGGGGLCMGIANDCLISSNRTFNSGGGAYSNVLNNCVLNNNFATVNGGGASRCTLFGCTVVSNTASSLGGGVSEGAVTNSIVYYNNGVNVFNTKLVAYACTTPRIGDIAVFTNAPLFVNLAGGDLHLQSNSPCLNAGNNAYVIGTTDLDGSPRVVGGTVDLGAYECQLPALLDCYTWLQSYGLPTDASLIYADADGDGMNNWQEWVAGTDPTNASSLLKMLSPAITVSGVTVQWQSVSGKIYFIQRSGDLSVPASFSTLQGNIAGQAGTTTYLDLTATGPGPFFYRVGVQ